MTIEELAPGHRLLPAFVAALQEAGLPTEDLCEAGQRFFGFENGTAFGGFLLDGRTALLRSLVVSPGRCRTGLGAAVLRMILDTIRDAGGTEAWLLTTTAADFFARQGFHAIDRSAAPPAILATAQFSTLCPTSAVLMCKTPV